MGKEIKICLPLYKMTYAVFFTAVLSVIRGVSITYEIGIALEPQMALLAVVFCADTYVQEIMSKRAEVERLWPLKNRMALIKNRMVIQQAYLLILAIFGYAMFLVVQKPFTAYVVEQGLESEFGQFSIYVFAIIVTLVFWGMLSNTLSCLFRNMWASISVSLVLWIVTDSTIGERLFGSWNLFSYTFRNVEGSGDLGWICGKIVCLCLCVAMACLLPVIIRKRG